MNRILFLLLLAITSFSLWGQWVSDPNINTPIFIRPGDTTLPKVAVTSQGGVFVSSNASSTGNYDLLLQYLDETGMPYWTHGGLLVSNHPTMTWITDYDMALAADSVAVIVYSDVRLDGSALHPNAYAVSKTGQFLWGNDGIQLSTEGTFEPSPVVTVTEAGNAVACWMRDTSPTSLVMQMISPTGQLLWGNGIVLSSTDNSGYEYPVITPVVSADGTSNEVIVMWVKRMGTSMYAPRYIAAQKYDGNGAPVWPAETIVSDNGSMPIYEHFTCVNDENGGVFISWFLYSGSLFDCYYQHVNSDGTVALPTNGVIFCESQGRMYLNPVLAYDKLNDILYAYCQMKNGNQDNWGVLGQKFNAAGTPLWTNFGTDIIPLSSREVENLRVQIAGDTSVLTFLGFSSVLNSNVIAMRVSPSGDPMWTNESVTMSTVQSSKQKMVSSPFVNNQMYVVWVDERNDEGDVYAQNIWNTGELGNIVGNSDQDMPQFSMELSHYPNPFNTLTTISYRLKSPGLANLEIYNIKGQLVKTLVSEKKQIGEYTISWNGRDAKNNPVASGVYFYRMTTGNISKTNKMVLLR